MKRQRILTPGPNLSTLDLVLTLAPQSSSAQAQPGGTTLLDMRTAGAGVNLADGEKSSFLAQKSGPRSRWAAESVQSRCMLAGYVDLQVDLHLLDRLPADGAHVELDVADDRVLTRLNECGDLLVAWFPPGSRTIMCADLTGSLHVVREGGTIAGYYRSAGCSVEISRYSFDNPPGFARLQIGTESSRFARQPVLEAFDAFRISRGRLECP